MDGLHGRMRLTEGRISELERGTMETTQSEQQRKETEKKKMDRALET